MCCSVLKGMVISIWQLCEWCMTNGDFLQSLAMYVPPDEPVQEQGEINMTFHPDDQNATNAYIVRTARNQPVIRPATHARMEDGGFVAAVNPIYQTYVHNYRLCLCTCI